MFCEMYGFGHCSLAKVNRLENWSSWFLESVQMRHLLLGGKGIAFVYCATLSKIENYLLCDERVSLVVIFGHYSKDISLLFFSKFCSFSLILYGQ